MIYYKFFKTCYLWQEFIIGKSKFGLQHFCFLLLKKSPLLKSVRKYCNSYICCIPILVDFIVELIHDQGKSMATDLSILETLIFSKSTKIDAYRY